MARRGQRLSRERVVAAALALVDREGLAALSMRRLGAELGVEAMALYRHAGSKDALLDDLVEVLYLELEQRLALAEEAGDVPGVPRWRSELHRIGRATYDVCLAHPGAVPLLSARMLAAPRTGRPLVVVRGHDRVLALLAEGGLDDARAAVAFRAFTGWLLGYVAVELCPASDGPDEPDPVVRLGLRHVPPDEVPGLRVALVLAERGGPEGLAAGLDALLDHLARPGGQGPE
ncbi:TetR/AcrR family transcriptional regulator [Streptomyces gilvus]|uniref:TetR/AcrR family transcriptional regulator n=1 Tax=Streptomyces gilvus TaxID=2920937 RepID=UPI001F0D3267|nr:TetR/AcrR family transcriptional regulator [Streptomyces sp. CME 23]MCH5670790.1 TetR/AcrR family transcriptional regulator [Streptomyces sp. CME 23]